MDDPPASASTRGRATAAPTTSSIARATATCHLHTRPLLRPCLRPGRHPRRLPTDASVKILAQPNRAGLTHAFDYDGIPGAAADTSLQVDARGCCIVVARPRLHHRLLHVVVNTIPVTDYLVFPEGFASTAIREFVSVVNANAFTVNYYRRPLLRRLRHSSIAYAGTVAANSHDPNGVTIIDGGALRRPHPRRPSPSSSSPTPLGAALAHYDFGTSIGDALSERTSNAWAFPRVEPTAGQVDDFHRLLQPQPLDVVVGDRPRSRTATSWFVLARHRTNRRGGWAIDSALALPRRLARRHLPHRRLGRRPMRGIVVS